MMKTTSKPIVAADGYHAGRWTKSEHEQFLVGLHLHGREWKRVARLVKTRTSAQIRSHAQKFFSKLHRDEREQERLAAEAASAAAAAAGVVAPGYLEVRAQSQRSRASGGGGGGGSRPARRRASPPKRAAVQAQPPLPLPVLHNVPSVMQGLIARRQRAFERLMRTDPTSTSELEQLRADMAQLDAEIASLRALGPSPGPRPLYVSSVPVDGLEAQRSAMATCMSPRSRAVLRGLSDDEVQALQVLSSVAVPEPEPMAISAPFAKRARTDDFVYY